MPNPAPPLIPADTLIDLITAGIRASEVLDPDHDAREWAAATARIASLITKAADRHGLKVTPGQIHWESHKRPVGIFGDNDPFRQTTITGTWKLALPYNLQVVLHGGPHHGRKQHLALNELGRAISVTGPNGAGPFSYRDHGWDPAAGVFVYKLNRKAAAA